MGPAEKVAASSPRTQIIPETLNLNAAERQIVEAALTKAGSIVEAAELCGVTRHHLKRLIVKHRIEWPRANVPRLYPTPEAT